MSRRWLEHGTHKSPQLSCEAGADCYLRYTKNQGTKGRSFSRPNNCWSISTEQPLGFLLHVAQICLKEVQIAWSVKSLSSFFNVLMFKALCFLIIKSCLVSLLNKKMSKLISVCRMVNYSKANIH